VVKEVVKMAEKKVEEKIVPEKKLKKPARKNENLVRKSANLVRKTKTLY